MGAEVRSEHHRDLERLDIALGGLIAVIPDAVDHATASLLSGDVALRAEVDRWQEMVVAVSDDVDRTAELIIARQSPVAGELRFVMTCVRLVLHLSDTIALVSEIGGSAALSLECPISSRVAPMLAAIGHEASAAWSEVSELWHEVHPDGRAALRLHEDHVSESRTSLAAELAAAGTDAVGATELGIALHGYDRILGHAISASSLIDALPHPGGYRQREEAGGVLAPAGQDGARGEDAAGGEDGAGGDRPAAERRGSKRRAEDQTGDGEGGLDDNDGHGDGQPPAVS